MPFAVNQATGFVYPFQQGSADERSLFRVMPMDASGSKMYFDSREQYDEWSQKNNRKTILINGLSTK